MIVHCPECSSRIRLDAQRFLGKRVKMRCARCKHVFKTEVPAGTGANLPGVRVLVAHSDQDLCEVVATLLTQEGFAYEICHDGEAALASLDRSPPHVALMDVALPGLFGFEVVEKVRSRPGLADVRIILLSSVFNKAAYKRTPSSLYGADDYIEKHHLIDRLVPKIRRFVAAHAPAADLPAPPSEPPPIGEEREALNERLRTAEERETHAGSADERIEKARRLARIIVSDIALYNQERVRKGVAEGSFFELLADEIAEGRKLYESRVDEEIRRDTDYLKDAFKAFISRQREQQQATAGNS